MADSLVPGEGKVDSDSHSTFNEQILRAIDVENDLGGAFSRPRVHQDSAENEGESELPPDPGKLDTEEYGFEDQGENDLASLGGFHGGERGGIMAHSIGGGVK